MLKTERYQNEKRKKKSKYDVSVIIPVYNVEKYIRDCVDSVLGQSFDNMEVILVDDGSKDESGKICDEYAKCHSHVRVFHEDNRGLSAARNMGLRHAGGKYLLFVDSDDWIHQDMLKECFAEAEKNDADLVICDILKTKVKTSKDETERKINTKAVQNVEACRLMYAKGNVRYVSVCNKLFKKSLFSNIHFTEGRSYEDWFISYYLLYNAKNIRYINKIFYYYRIRENSICTRKLDKHNLDYPVGIFKGIRYYLTQQETELVNTGKRFLLFTTMELFEKYLYERQFGNAAVCYIYFWHFLFFDKKDEKPDKNRSIYLKFLFFPWYVLFSKENFEENSKHQSAGMQRRDG